MDSQVQRRVTWTGLERDIRRLRRIGVVTTRSVPRDASLGVRAAADAIATLAGYRGLGEKWTSVSPAEAEAVLLMVLEHDLAYESDVMTHVDAARLAADFLAHVGREAEFLTNGTWATKQAVGSNGAVYGPAWEPVSKATFDAGVVGVGSALVAMVWVEDED